MLLLLHLNLQSNVRAPIQVQPPFGSCGVSPHQINRRIHAQARPIRIIAHDGQQHDDKDIEDILIMVSHLWH